METFESILNQAEHDRNFISNGETEWKPENIQFLIDEMVAGEASKPEGFFHLTLDTPCFLQEGTICIEKTSEDTGYAVLTPAEIAHRLGEEVNAWNKKCSGEMVVMLNGIKRHCKEYELDDQHFINMSGLPSAQEVPSEIADYPVWCIDKYGSAVVGESAEFVEDVCDISC